ncbi:MAG: hypothetical protein AAF909_04875 [Pseudomonadota bacterium]
MSLITLLVAVIAIGLAVALARRPLSRRGYWTALSLLLAAHLGALLAVDRMMGDLLAPPTAGEDRYLAVTVGGLYALGVLVSLVLIFYWAARRLIDAGYPRAWALLGLAPPFFLAFGVPASQSAHAVSPDQTATTFE